MSSCLGIYIENNLIKYAKVKKEKDDIKVEAFNVEFYENLSDSLKKIINETNSSKIPISVNVSNELYNYFEVFKMLKPKDIKESLATNFEDRCNEKGYNYNSLESRYILMDSKENDERYKALHVAVNKTDINTKTQNLKGCKLTNLTPITTSITNLIDVGEKDNIAIINIEEETKITTIVEGQIYRVDILQDGMGKVLKEINNVENSMKKSYEVCKNVTIYTQENQSVNSEGNEHLEDVMPTLYKIVTESKRIIDSSLATINKVYITGLGTAINNIDLYFQEYMVNVKCEILKPFFIESSSVKIPIKEYIEVNSAIALALDGLGYGNKSLNFVGGGKSGGLTLDTNIDLGSLGNLFKGKGKKEPGAVSAADAIKGPLDTVEKTMTRGCIAIMLVIIIFTGVSRKVYNEIQIANEKVKQVSTEIDLELKTMEKDAENVNASASYYMEVIENFKALANSQEENENARIINKDAIPNMLNKIMFLIPRQVRIVSIQNTESDTIVIEAESEKYEQLGYFTSILKTESVLTNIKSSSGSKSNGIVKITIEGELP